MMFSSASVAVRSSNDRAPARSHGRRNPKGSEESQCREHNPYEEGTDMARWEYKIADLTKVEKDITALNQLGTEGREAVGMLTTWGAGGFRFVRPIALLKRPVPDR
jgi:hypothetical protein